MRFLHQRQDAIDRQLAALEAAGTNLSDYDYRSINAEYESVTDQIWDLEDALLIKPLKSRGSIATKLRIVAGRLGLAFDIEEHINMIVAQVQEWQRREPVLWP